MEKFFTAFSAAIIFLAQAASAHVVSAKDAASTDDARTAQLVLAVKHIIELQAVPDKEGKAAKLKPVFAAVPNAATLAKPKDITAELLADYDIVLRYLSARAKETYVLGHERRVTKAMNVPLYNRGYRQLSENLNIFTLQGTCNTECKRLIFENYVTSVTIVSPRTLDAGTYNYAALANSQKRIPDQTSEKADVQEEYIKGTGFSKADLQAIRYSRAETCQPNAAMGSRSNELQEIPLLGFCLDSSEADIPARGFYNNILSPLFPAKLKPAPAKPVARPAFTSVDRSLSPEEQKIKYENIAEQQKQYAEMHRAALLSKDRIFPELKDVMVQVDAVDHWATTVRGRDHNDAAIRYEAACVKVSPVLPPEAISVLLAEHTPPRAQGAFRAQVRSFPGGSICYGPGDPTRFSILSEVNAFFPKTDFPFPRYDFVKALSVDDIAARLNAFKFTAPHKPPVSKNAAPSEAAARALAYQSLTPMMRRDNQRNQQQARNFWGTVDALELSDPRFKTDIAPKIAPKILARLAEGHLATDKRAVNFLRALPAGTLSDHIDTLDEIITSALGGEDCSDWNCHTPGYRAYGEMADRQELIALLAAGGPQAAPLLQKAYDAGLSDLHELAACTGDMPSKMKADYLKIYQSQEDFVFAKVNMKRLPIPDELPISPKLMRLYEQAFNARKSVADSGPNRRPSGINLADGYAFQGDDIVFTGRVDAEIITHFQKNGLMDYMEYVKKRSYGQAKALLQTEHKDAVLVYLKDRLIALDRPETLALPQPSIDLSDMEDTIIIGGTNIKDLVKPQSMAKLERAEIQGLIDDLETQLFTCPYRVPNYSFY